VASFFAETGAWGEKFLHPLHVPGACHVGFLITTHAFVYGRCAFSVFTALPLISLCFHKEQSDLACPPAFVFSISKSLNLRFPVFLLTESGFLIYNF